jgi:flagellar hook-length control protein FliK
MNELLNTVNLPALSAESLPGVSLKEGQSTGADGFAVMLCQLGQAIPALVLPGMTEAGTQQGEVSPAAQVALLQLLNSVGLTGQQQAMDGSSTGSLPINSHQGEVSPTAQVALLQLLGSVGLTGQQQAMDGSSTGSLPISGQQDFDLMSLNLGASPVETLVTARQLLASAIPASTDPQLIVVSEQQPSVDVASLNGAECRLPVDLMLSSGDLTRLQSILSKVPSTSPQSMAMQPNLSLATSAKSVATLPEVSSQLGGLEQLLKEQFPTLNIENLSAQLHLKSPELVKKDTAPITLPKILPSDGLPTKPSTGQSVNAILQQATPQNRPQINGFAEVLSSTTSPDLSASLTAAALSSPVTQPAPTVAVSQTTLPTETKPHSDLTTTPEIIKTVQEGSLEKTAAKAVDTASNYPQTAQHWNKLTSDQSDPPVAKQVMEAGEPQIDKTKFRIQFDRFQIDALLQRSEIKLQLHPANLGSMRVKLVSTSQEVTARFETTSEAARIAVEQNLPQLRESLDKAGIKVDHVEVVLDEQRARQQQSHYQSQRKHTSDTDIADNATQKDPSEGGGGISTAVQSMLGSLNLLA